MDYLTKLPAENAVLPAEHQSRHWAVLIDMEYIGLEHTTPDFCWLTPIKDPRTPHDVLYNQSVGRVRVHVK